MKDYELDHLFNLLEEKNWSEVYSLGQHLIRDEDNSTLEDAMDFLTVADSDKEHLEIYPEVLAFARKKAEELRMTKKDIDNILHGF